MNAKHEEPKTGIALLDKIFYDAETNRYGIISLLLILVGCMGGGAVYTGGMESTAELILIVTSTMFSLSVILAVAPIKLILYSCITSVILSTVIIILNLFVL